jgi:hypothetical protein
MVDAEGNLYDGDQLLFAIVRSRARSAPVKGVVGTLMSNLALEHALGKLDIPFARAAVGDRYVVEMLNEKGWLYRRRKLGSHPDRSIATRPAMASSPPCRFSPHCARSRRQSERACWAVSFFTPRS